MRDEAVSNAEISFVRDAFAESLRVDGRALNEARRARFELHDSAGNAEVDAVAPYADRPKEGTISFSVEVSPAASEHAAFEYGLMGASAGGAEGNQMLTRLIEHALRDSRALEAESLCILAGQLVWSVKVVVYVVDNCGNATDAAALAAIAALKHAHRPDVSIVGTEVTIHPITHREPVPLPVHHVPIATTFALLDATSALVDPGLQEERAAEGFLTVVANAHGEICCVHKAGSVCVQAELILRCVKEAVGRAKTITAQLQRTLGGGGGNAAAADSVGADDVFAGAKERAMELKGLSIGTGKDHASMEVDTGAHAVPQADKLESAHHDGRKRSTRSPPPPPPPPPPAEDYDADLRDQPPPPPPKFPASAEAAQPERSTPSPPLQKPAPPAHRVGARSPSSSSSSSPPDSDEEDLMNALISRPRGGGGRRPPPKAKR